MSVLYLYCTVLLEDTELSDVLYSDEKINEILIKIRGTFMSRLWGFIVHSVPDQWDTVVLMIAQVIEWLPGNHELSTAGDLGHVTNYAGMPWNDSEVRHHYEAYRLQGVLLFVKYV